MKLLYLYIENYGCIKDQEFNFDSNYHFHLEKEDSKVWRIIEDKVEHPLPSDFWASSSGKHNVVESVSAIVGENGSGKTTLAKFIGEELIPNRNNPREKYIVIFKQKRKLQYQYNLNNKLVDSDNRKISKNMSFIPSQVVYYSPFLTSEHPLVSRYVFDLSTTYLLRTRAAENNNVESQYNAYQAGERKAAINFMAKYHELYKITMNRENSIKPFFSLPLPMAIRIIHPKKIRDSFVFSYLNKIEPNSTIKKVMATMAQPRTNDFFIRTFIDYIATWCTQHVKENGVIIQSPSDNMHGLDRIDNYLNCLDAVNEQLSSIDSALTYLPEGRYSTPNDILYKELYNKILGVLQLCNDKAYSFFEILSQFLWEDYNIPITDDISDLGISCQYLKDINPQNKLKELIDKYSECKLNFDFLRFEFDPLISSGEMAFLSIFSRIYEMLKYTLVNQEDFILFLDEAETTLHPEWQRLLISHIINFLEEFAVGHKVQVIFASHSPILLSDIPDSNVVFLKKRIDGHTEVVNQEKTGKTFASNIYTLYKKSFFMTEGLMGKFAEQKIDDIIKELIQLELNVQIGDVTGKCENLQRQIRFIGEPVIRKQLEDRLNWIQRLPYRTNTTFRREEQ